MLGTGTAGIRIKHKRRNDYGKIITISRQYGSGGSEIGRKVAKSAFNPVRQDDNYVTAKESGLIPNT
ncbi:MAG: cytidylate kinase family protein [[Eubacterium] siraeum]